MEVKNLKFPVFILGTQRAGTTLLTRILSTHKDLFIQNEISVEKVFTGTKNAESILSLMDRQIEERHGCSLEDLLEKENKTVWGVKDPEFSEYLDELQAFIPGSKFLLIIRDGRGVVNSYIENKWGLGTNAYTGAIRWQDEIHQQMEFARKYPDDVLVLRFEDLVANMEVELRRICEHLSLPFDEDMLKYDKKKAMFKENPHNTNTNKSPDKKLAEKWQAKLSSREIALIEHVAGKTLKEHGYQLIGDKVAPSALEKVYYKLHQRIVGEIQLQWQWRKSLLKKRRAR
ncbi:hypothetical protein BTA51_10415 [Hahella sp. CCB-MM4]|uniref:sulfotransferase family protein n=1 Tax=Hahella sp. (strain CCB-MM4) TaxID=1926491 RepID=UPI000B9BB150|nr:sulfotransferase [Hahella sp. CCB-MM4]OZG73430.1 hypothetical protein BTA51_10415 [Hahella sp. CCB-MM4]